MTLSSAGTNAHVSEIAALLELALPKQALQARLCSMQAEIERDWSLVLVNGCDYQVQAMLIAWLVADEVTAGPGVSFQAS